jgi:hypothetical protein
MMTTAVDLPCAFLCTALRVAMLDLQRETAGFCG